jgi:hypothetical protein
VFDRGRVDGKRVTNIREAILSARRGEQMRQKSLCFTLATIWGSVILSAVSIATIRMPILSLSIRFFSSPFASSGPNIRTVSASPMNAITHHSNSRDAPYNLFPAYHLQEPVVAQMTHWKANDQNGEAAF